MSDFKLPEPPKGFIRNTVKYVLYFAIVGLTVVSGYLLKNYNSAIEKQDKEIAAIKKECKETTTALRFELDTWKERARRIDSTLADAKATFRILKELGKIQ